MAFFAVTYTYAPDPRRDEVRPAHRAFLGGLAERGVIRASGPCPGTEPAQALLVLEVDSAEAAREALADDPFQQESMVADIAVVEWNPIIGDLAR